MTRMTGPDCVVMCNLINTYSTFAYIYIHKFIYIHIYIHIHTYTSIHTYIHTHIYIYIHTYIHTKYMHASFSFLPFFCLFGVMSLFPTIFAPLPLSLCMESTSYVVSFRMVFSYLVTAV